MKKQIDYSEVIKRKQFIKELKNMGFILIPKRNYKILGYSLIGLGIITWFVPFTTIPLIILGCYFLGISKYHLIEKIRKKFKYNLYLLKHRFKS